MKKNSYLTNRPEFGTAPKRIEAEDQPNEYIWSKTFGNCALCGGDLGTVHVLMKPEHLFVCNPCSDRKRQRTVSEYRSTVFGWGSVYNQKANFYFERLMIEPDYFRSESAAFVAEFNPYL